MRRIVWIISNLKNKKKNKKMKWKWKYAWGILHCELQDEFDRKREGEEQANA